MIKKKELLFLSILALALLSGWLFLSSIKKETTIVEVRYKDDSILLTFDIDKDATYEVYGDVGVVHIEVKDGRYRVYDVDCPNHICEKMGWIDKGSVNGITCLPNGIYIFQK
ncbi:MAG: NusG domain II-containing protein [Erysipelotrichaceae bacterium]|jgi:hypothetical protein|nr:NusG domain II-containing protein [Erysipelotrichaceae bacterium]